MSPPAGRRQLALIRNKIMLSAPSSRMEAAISQQVQRTPTDQERDLWLDHQMPDRLLLIKGFILLAAKRISDHRNPARTDRFTVYRVEMNHRFSPAAAVVS